MRAFRAAAAQWDVVGPFLLLRTLLHYGDLFFCLDSGFLTVCGSAGNCGTTALLTVSVVAAAPHRCVTCCLWTIDQDRERVNPLISYYQLVSMKQDVGLATTL
jgi:hypothetical protein